MAAFIIDVDDLNASYFISITNTESWLLAGVIIANNLSNPVFSLLGLGIGFTSDGTILAQSTSPGITVSGVDVSLTFGASSVFRSGAMVGTPAILATGGGTTVTNHGLISTAKGVAMVMVTGGNSIYNDGWIEGGSGGVFLGTNGFTGDTLINDGTITAGNAQLPVFSERFNHAIQIEGDGTLFINHGTLAAVAAFGSGVNIGSFSFSGAGSRVENYGTITSAHWYAVNMVTLNNGGATLFNQGLIAGGNGAVAGSSFHDVVVNSGTMQGIVDLAGGDDRYDGRGGMVFGLISGGDGNDTVIGGAQDDDLTGYLGHDLARGGAGDDAVAGFAGSDTIYGGAGDDTITGGFGRDVMTGGAGADVFIFGSSAEIGNSGATRDQIVDFTTKQDVLDFGVLPGTLIYIGAAVFSNVVGQLRFTAATGLLEGDTNGNGTADFTLFLGVGTVLAAGDLVL